MTFINQRSIGRFYGLLLQLLRSNRPRLWGIIVKTADSSHMYKYVYRDKGRKTGRKEVILKMRYQNGLPSLKYFNLNVFL